MEDGQLVFYRVRDLQPAELLSPQRGRRMTLEPRMVPPLPSKAKLCGRPGDRASLLALGPEDSLSRGHRRARLRAARPPPGHRPQNGRSSASRGRRCRRPREPDRRNSSRCLSLDKIRSDGWSNTNTRSAPRMLEVPRRAIAAGNLTLVRCRASLVSAESRRRFHRRPRG